ncbi:hypothetical protein LK994_13400 [Ferruginibacter lapsinanis]|uniref:hypothetical protein n=1 Tax=Ferruginibacter lapsinanis TaxID=563172 RepID=UPI001E460142|nr:hypothetical protein [Ferruginibacter lapsinanis]UEG49632.1 hypothetical protein LK994_13400 [Ferruginibacter lapsinanis]
MKEDNIKTKGAAVVIPDECGDSLWDEVLQQEVKACKANAISDNAVSLLINIEKTNQQ